MAYAGSKSQTETLHNRKGLETDPIKNARTLMTNVVVPPNRIHATDIYRMILQSSTLKIYIVLTF